MDIGKFKASRWRLMGWIVVPPVLMAIVGLSSYAWNQRATWRLSQAQSLAEVMPVLAEAQVASDKLIRELGLNAKVSIKSEDQLISFLQDVANRHGFIIDAVKVERLEGSQVSGIPTLSASVSGSAEFSGIQTFLNDIQSTQNMISVEVMQLSLPRGQVLGNAFQASLTINLMLIEQALSTTGGRA